MHKSLLAGTVLGLAMLLMIPSSSSISEIQYDSRSTELLLETMMILQHADRAQLWIVEYDSDNAFNSKATVIHEVQKDGVEPYTEESKRQSFRLLDIPYIQQIANGSCWIKTGTTTSTQVLSICPIIENDQLIAYTTVAWTGGNMAEILYQHANLFIQSTITQQIMPDVVDGF